MKFHANVGKNSKVLQLQIMSGPPALLESALAAAKQWRYQPTLVNGMPYCVDTEIDVQFRLQD